MYIFAHLIKYINSNVNIKSYSDFQSIVDDTPYFANPLLINYDTFELNKLNTMSIFILR